MLRRTKDGSSRSRFFCTQGGSGAEKVFRDLAELCGKAPVATLAVNDREINTSAYAQPLARFATAITASAKPACLRELPQA
jgi:hypothetical protein